MRFDIRKFVYIRAPPLGPMQLGELRVFPKCVVKCGGKLLKKKLKKTKRKKETKNKEKWENGRNTKKSRNAKLLATAVVYEGQKVGL